MIQPATDKRSAIVDRIVAANAAAKRIPTHWADSKAAIHLRIDTLLDELEALDE